ncbi:hypothetical protein TNIN_373691 [Trichonephila inaurata madagascariensis]|uniref:Uncharacterized protein n=1 Tax=Trichonephila inaurata madagascariensis TaxID=2747483 RepID=A0A8X7CAC6_9ARAC|nr:hypothetical protein TNIN_373691 [Trichonephila inaurata madagascariensis]
MHKDKELNLFLCEVFGHKASECPDNNDTEIDVAHLIVHKAEALNKRALVGDLVLDALIDSGEGSKRLEKPDPMIQCITEEPDEYIVADTEELHLDICHEDLKENNACIPLEKTDPVVVVPEMVNRKRRKKEDVPLKTYQSDHLGPHRITNFKEGVMEQTVRFVQDLEWFTTKDIEEAKIRRKT